MKSDHVKSDKSSSVAAAHVVQGKSGKSLPAVPAIQRLVDSNDPAGPEDSKLNGIRQAKIDASSSPSNNPNSANHPKPGRSPNKTGLPDDLKQGIETLSGISLDDVKVRYNSDKPFQMQALAYAQGSEIHLGPGQEKHLPHEAWHIVQQNQGRVKATAQLKVGIPVNDDPTLESEADKMGEAASRVSVKSGQILQRASASENVIQRRLPVLNKAVIASNIDLTKDLLIHALRYMTNTERIDLVAYFGMGNRTWITEETRDIIRGTRDSDLLFDTYQILKGTLTEQNKFQDERQEDSEPAAAQNQQIIDSLPQIVERINIARGAEAMIASVFGPNAQVDVIQQVYGAVATALDGHIAHGTSPVKLMGNEKHSKWIGAGAIATHGAPTVSLGEAILAQLAAGNVAAQAELVHELTHSAAGTHDHAYGVDGCFRLTPVKKARNATNFEHGYVMANGDPAGYVALYAAAALVEANDIVAPDSDEVRQKKLVARKVINIATEVWNNCDNAYLAAQRMIDKTSNGEIDLKLVNLAAAPYTYSLENRRMILALLEDRTQALNRFKKLSDIRKAMKGIPANVLNKSERQVFAYLTKDALNMDESLIVRWAARLENPGPFLV